MSTNSTASPQFGAPGREPVPQTPIHDAAARRHGRRGQRQERRGRRRHAGREEQRVGAALEPRQHAFGLVAARIVGAAIGTAAAVLVVGVAFIGRRHVNRRNERLGGRIDPAERLGAEVSGERSLSVMMMLAGTGRGETSKLDDATGNKKAGDPALSPVLGAMGKRAFLVVRPVDTGICRCLSWPIINLQSIRKTRTSQRHAALPGLARELLGQEVVRRPGASARDGGCWDRRRRAHGPARDISPSPASAFLPPMPGPW